MEVDLCTGLEGGVGGQPRLLWCLCRGHAQFSAFASDTPKWQLGFGLSVGCSLLAPTVHLPPVIFSSSVSLYFVAQARVCLG